MADALENADRRVTYIEPRRGGHPLASSETRRRLLTETIAFLRRHISEAPGGLAREGSAP